MLSFVIALLLFSESYSEQKHALHFSYITTITGGIRAIGGRPVIDLALEEINNRDDILQNYTLNYTTIRNSECSRTAALNSFFADFPYTTNSSQQTTFLALLCCGCSPATIPVAEISHYWNIPQIAFAAAANGLTDRSRFKSFFRPLPSFEFIGVSLAELVRRFQWKQMAVVSQDETLFTGVNAVLRDSFNKENWLLDESAIITSDEEYFKQEGLFPFDTAFSWMDNGDFRVIHINAYAEYSYMILCKAHELDLLPPKYVWITPMWYNKEWWKPISKTLSFACNESELLEVLIGSIGVVPDGYFVTENETAEILSKQTPKAFIDEYKRRLSLPEYDNLEELGIAGVAYDTIWSIALAFDEAINRITNNNDDRCGHLSGELVPLEQFDYNNKKMGCILEQSMANVQFTGITGPIHFNSVGSRPDNVLLVQQYRLISDTDIERETVAEIIIGDNGNAFMNRNDNHTSTKLWKSGIPYDGSPDEVIHPGSIILAGIYYSFAAVGLVFLLACLIFNIVFRNKKVVKLSSPNVNYLIIVGAALLYVSVCLFVTPIESETIATIICNFRQWLFSLGYTLCFAVILAKTWRIYHIFSNPTAKKIKIKDWLLLVIIVIIVAVDIMILLIGTAIPTSRLQGTIIRDKEQFNHISAAGINQKYFVYVCSTGNSVIWLGISFAYKGLLQIVGIFMAFHIRRVKIKALNDSKETGAIIYINSIILVLMIVAVFVLEGYHNVHAALFGLALFVQASLFLGLLFIPKAVSLYRDPEGSKIFTSNMKTGNQLTGKDDVLMNKTMTLNGNGSDPQDTLRRLKTQVKQLEDNLTVRPATDNT